jgi:hypothetical protein
MTMLSFYARQSSDPTNKDLLERSSMQINPCMIIPGNNNVHSVDSVIFGLRFISPYQYYCTTEEEEEVFRSLACKV